MSNKVTGPRNAIYDDILDTRVHTSSVDPRNEIQKLKEEYDRMKKMKMGMDYGMAVNDYISSSEIAITDNADLAKHRQSLKESLERMQKALEVLDAVEDAVTKLPFKIGDPVFHKTLGNVLVQRIEMNENDLDNIYYRVIGIQGGARVLAKECLPCNETTKVLYGNK